MAEHGSCRLPAELSGAKADQYDSELDQQRRGDCIGRAYGLRLSHGIIDRRTVEWGAGYRKDRAEDKLHPWGGAGRHLHRSWQWQQTGNQQTFSDRGGQKQHCWQGSAV
ncbi:hypothetical protein D3C79_780750 [compost metagenome]